MLKKTKTITVEKQQKKKLKVITTVTYVCRNNCELADVMVW